ncbi:hypothetical protein NQZ68_019987 [Dissostichus eleginoides]|nr:hypothetical protein NQZ68_019987 [Dissostichus eleginoides]
MSLRDKWEKKAQSVADQIKQEAEWKEKSSKVVSSKWNYHWSLVATGDFKKITSGADEEEKKKPKIKFKVVAPPPKPKHEPAPPPPPPRKTASPKPLWRKRKVEVDVFGLCWKDSWMSLKPPKYLFLKAKERKTKTPGFTTIELTNSREFKAKVLESEPEHAAAPEDDEWRLSWKQGLKRKEENIGLLAVLCLLLSGDIHPCPGPGVVSIDLTAGGPAAELNTPSAGFRRGWLAEQLAPPAGLCGLALTAEGCRPSSRTSTHTIGVRAEGWWPSIGDPHTAGWLQRRLDGFHAI